MSRVVRDAISQRNYNIDLTGFTADHWAGGNNPNLPQLQQRWIDAANAATKRLDLTPQETLAVLRVQEMPRAGVATTLAPPSNAVAEPFYRMMLLDTVANELTRIFKHSSMGTEAAARRWLRMEHLDGPFKARRPLEAVTAGAAHELKRLSSYLQAN